MPQNHLNKFSETTTSNLSPVDYRIAIADHCSCPDFRDTVLSSGSNTNSAIYFRSKHLTAIAKALGCVYTDPPVNKTLRFDIRQQLGLSETKAHGSGEQTDLSTLAPETPRGQLSTDGGVVDHSLLPTEQTKPFTHPELKTLAETLDVDLSDAPYIEPEIRKFAGSSIAGPYLAHLIKSSYIDPYLSINVGSTTAEYGSRAYYPFRLKPVHEIPKTATDHADCLRFIVDSSIDNPRYDNSDALNTAARVGADAVILADEYHDVEGTVEAVVDGLELYETHEFSGEVIIPLQPPHDICYQKLRDRGVSADHTFALGGLKDTNDDKAKIAAARDLRAVVPEGTTLHGLGFGITDSLASEIRSNPNLLDSVDYSTPAHQPVNETHPGDERLCSVAAHAGATLIEDLRKISPLVDDLAKTQLTDF